MVFALALQFLAPLQGVSTALVGPVELLLPDPDSNTQSDAQPDEARGADGIVAPQNHGCGEGGVPTEVASCATDAATCVEEMSEPPADCVTPLVQAVQEATEPGEEPEPPCAEGTPQQQLVCAVDSVRTEACPDDEETCAPLDLVSACLEAPDVPGCAASTVVAETAKAVCDALGDEDPEEGAPTCKERLTDCAQPDSGACEDALEYLAERLETEACDSASEACVVVAQIETLLACASSQACAFQAVWDEATPLLCELVGDGECQTTLDTCDDPTQGSGCQDAADYLLERSESSACAAEDAVCLAQGALEDCAAVDAQSCESGLYALVVDVACAGTGDCPPEPLPSMRDCVSWADGAPQPNAPCVQAAVVAAICAAQAGSCVLEHPAIQALLVAADDCQGESDEGECERGIQAVAVAALCADPGAEPCFETWAQEAAACKGPSDLACHALALLHQACGDGGCPAELAALEPCVSGAATQKCGEDDLVPFLRGWIIEQCVAKGSASGACPERAEVRVPRDLASPPDSQPVREPSVFQNGSTSFPFHTIGAALSALHTPAAWHLALDGRINVGGGTYAETVSIPANTRDITILTPSGVPPTLDGGSGTALSLAKGHRLRITGALHLAGAVPVSGPSVTTSLDIRDRRVYVDRAGSMELSYANVHPTPTQTVATPETVAVVLAISGPSGVTASDVQVQVDGSPVTLTDAGGTFEATVASGIGGIGVEPSDPVTFSGRRTVTLTVAAPGVY
ncbi:MAG TPA: hypothetical protein VNU01_06205, partial [Egibacteraceae bacterium]|nr:hypothetical protein [Egibacteraceae bacterium]